MLKPGDVLDDPDPYSPHEPEWCVVETGPRYVRCVHLVWWTVWEWRLHDDGIRVERARELPRDDPWDDPNTEWITEAINRYPAPEAVERHLRG